MDFNFLSHNNFKIQNSNNKKNIISPKQIRNYNYNSNNIANPISPIKTQNYGQYNTNLEKDLFFNANKINSYNQLFNYRGNYDSSILTNKNYKNTDNDNKSINLNENMRNRERNNHLLKNNKSHSLITDKKSTKTSYNFFDYSNNDNNNNYNINNNKNSIDFHFNNKIDSNNNNNYYINKDDFWNIYDYRNININDNQRIILRNRSSSFFDDKKKKNISQNDNDKNSIFLNDNNNRINCINDYNNKSLSSYKSLNHGKYRYLFDYNENNNKFVNKDYNNLNNNLSLHDKYISPDYIDALKSKNFYAASQKDEKSQYLYSPD
jgi:hypothetical protein